MVEAETIEEGRSGGHGRGSYTFNGAPDSRPICQICKKRGHIAPRCWSHFDHSFQTPPPSSLQANVTSSNWFPDTAANHHYTPDVSNLRFDCLPYEGTESISLGDGSSIPIQSHGFRDASSSSQGPR